MQERDREGQTLLFAAREFSDETVEFLSEPDAFGQRSRCRTQAIIGCVEVENFPNARLFGKRRRLQLHADAAAQFPEIAPAGGVEPEHADVPGRRLRQADAALERRGLTGAVATEQTEDRAGRYVERHVVHGCDGSEALDQAAHRYRRFRHTAPRRSPGAQCCERSMRVPAGRLRS